MPTLCPTGSESTRRRWPDPDGRIEGRGFGGGPGAQKSLLSRAELWTRTQMSESGEMSGRPRSVGGYACESTVAVQRKTSRGETVFRRREKG